MYCGKSLFAISSHEKSKKYFLYLSGSYLVFALEYSFPLLLASHTSKPLSANKAT